MSTRFPPVGRPNRYSAIHEPDRRASGLYFPFIKLDARSAKRTRARAQRRDNRYHVTRWPGGLLAPVQSSRLRELLATHFTSTSGPVLAPPSLFQLALASIFLTLFNWRMRLAFFFNRVRARGGLALWL